MDPKVSGRMWRGFVFFFSLYWGLVLEFGGFCVFFLVYTGVYC